MYAIRSYYVLFLPGCLKLRLQQEFLATWTVISMRNRITSYNVCYTKLLRINQNNRKGIFPPFTGRDEPESAPMNRPDDVLPLAIITEDLAQNLSYNFV